MVSSFSIFFIIAFYLYFKQYYEKLIHLKVTGIDEIAALKKKLTRKLMIFPAGIVAIVLLYAISFTLMNLYPDVDNVKSSRRVVDVAATLLCMVVFFIDKRELDTRLSAKQTQPVKDNNEPGIAIFEDVDIV